jgi:nucleotide-binding universal stress UspA family protein
MKTILVPTAAHDLIGSVLETALLAARRFDSYVEGFALRPLITEYVPVDMVGGLTWARDDISDEQAVAAARQTFERFMAERGVARFIEGAGSAHLGYGWLEDATAGDAFVSSHARVFDLTVLGRPTAGQAEPSMATLEAVLFESGRPILIAPPAAPSKLGDVVVIAWNGSTETARATGFVMPFLRQAGRVIVMTVEGAPVHGPSGEQMTRSLRRNGIAAEAMTVPADRRSIGEALLKTSAALGADLLVKGAYTQSRLRQMIFGGTTSHILAEATLPVFMAH